MNLFPDSWELITALYIFFIIHRYMIAPYKLHTTEIFSFISSSFFHALISQACSLMLLLGRKQFLSPCCTVWPPLHPLHAKGSSVNSLSLKSCQDMNTWIWGLITDLKWTFISGWKIIFFISSVLYLLIHLFSQHLYSGKWQKDKWDVAALRERKF